MTQENEQLVTVMRYLSGEYGMPWADRWDDHLGDSGWLKNAVKNTYSRLSDDDKAIVKENYERFLEPKEYSEFLAECYILDRNGWRVKWEGKYKTFLKYLKGKTRQEAINQIDTRFHQFKEWW